MPRIRLILEDENGQALPNATEQVYELEGICDTLNQIEQAVEKFKNTALPQMEQTLLTQAQQRFVAAEKKNGLTLNGRRLVHLQTLHGQFVLAEQKFLRSEFSGSVGCSSSYLRCSGQSHVSVGLQEFCLFACSRMSSIA